jgi:AraC-like DNA-binding protein
MSKPDKSQHESGRTLAGTARWTYDTEHAGAIGQVPELITFGCDEIRKAIPLHRHEHPGCYEFVFVERGKAGWELGEAVYETLAGDVFHTRPGESHRGGFDAIEPSKFWWVIVQAPHPNGWLRLAPDECDTFALALASLPRIVHTGMQPVEPFTRLKRALQNGGPFRCVAVRQAIVELLLLFVVPYPNGANVADDLLLRFDTLTARMRHEPDWRPSVAELADLAGLSPSHFFRTFQAYTGLSPMSYMERLRLKEACRKLAETAVPVTDIAHELGYRSSQHFATVFKRYNGMTPSGWRSFSKSQRSTT